MKQLIPVLFISMFVTSSCSKNSLTQPAPALALSSTESLARGADDTTPDDRGRGVSSGGGDRISPASVPAPVMNAYKSRYPNATRAEWKKLSNGNYKVEFFLSGIKRQSIFSPSGRLLKEERG